MPLAHIKSSSTVNVSSQTSDDELVMHAVNGDERAFEVIMRRNNQLMFRTARSVLSNDADAEDVVQEAYLRAWRALGHFRAQAKLSTWLIRIVINEALGRLRRKTAQIIPLDAAMDSFEPHMKLAMIENPDDQPDRVAMRSELRKMMEMRIDLLPDLYRTVFMLRAVEEMSAMEVAQALEIPEATVRTRYFRARSLLREGLTSEIETTVSDLFSFDGERCDRIVSHVLNTLKKDNTPKN